MKRYDHDDLPAVARTLLKIPKRTEISSLGSGSYFNYCLEKGLVNQLKLLDANKISSVIALHLNTDGLPLAKSSASQIWPSLFKIVNYSHASCNPFVVGIFHGNAKPQNVDVFFDPTILEYIELSTTGFIFNNRLYRISIRLFTADTVARNYVIRFLLIAVMWEVYTGRKNNSTQACFLRKQFIIKN